MADQGKTIAKELLRMRSRRKKSKPAFVRPESWRYTRLKESWRRPRGLDHKMRRKKKGWPPTVNVGYRGPKAARNLHPSGYKEVLVKNVEEIGAIDPKTHAMRIAHTVGRRKKIRIITEARKRKIKILNIKEAAEKTQEPIEEKEETEETEEKQEPEQKEKPKRKKKTKKTEEEAEEQ